jgi:hypothetical protein
VWIERQLRLQVPASYVMLTFTVPAELRELAWYHQSWLYAKLFECAWETVNDFCHNDKRLQGKPGTVAVLHTHSRRLDYHPHVHLVMPAAALDESNKLWRTKCVKASKDCRRARNFGYQHPDCKRLIA